MRFGGLHTGYHLRSGRAVPLWIPMPVTTEAIRSRNGSLTCQGGHLSSLRSVTARPRSDEVLQGAASMVLTPFDAHRCVCVDAERSVCGGGRLGHHGGLVEQQVDVSVLLCQDASINHCARYTTHQSMNQQLHRGMKTRAQLFREPQRAGCEGVACDPTCMASQQDVLHFSMNT